MAQLFVFSANQHSEYLWNKKHFREGRHFNRKKQFWSIENKRKDIFEVSEECHFLFYLRQITLHCCLDKQFTRFVVRHFSVMQIHCSYSFLRGMASELNIHAKRESNVLFAKVSTEGESRTNSQRNMIWQRVFVKGFVMEVVVQGLFSFNKIHWKIQLNISRHSRTCLA